MMRNGDEDVAPGSHVPDGRASESMVFRLLFGGTARVDLVDGALDHLPRVAAPVDVRAVPATNKRLFRWIIWPKNSDYRRPYVPGPKY